MPAPCFIAVTLAGMLASGKPAKDARAYLFIGPSTRISPVVSAPGERPHARSEITIGPIMTFARETAGGGRAGAVRGAGISEPMIQKPMQVSPQI